jgi:hypothetical protein
MEPVNARCAGKKHEWALSRDYLHAFGGAERKSFGANGTFTTRPVHPDLLDSSVETVGNHLFSDLGRSHKQRSPYWRVDILHPSEAAMSIDAGSCRIYGHDLVTAAAEFFKESDTYAFRLA